MSNNPIKGVYSFISLGCPKNLVDSERMLGLLHLDGYELVDDPVGTDFVIVNTCGFIESARDESFAAIDEMLALKQQGKTGGVLVSGCLAERQKEDLLTSRPGIDALMGVFARDEVTKVADRLVGDQTEQRALFRPAAITAQDDRGRFRVTPRHFAYLKISEGCDRLCTFCAIPLMRGKHVTKPIEAVLQEAEELAADGVRELNLVAQDLTNYGMDLYGEPRLAHLLQGLELLDGIDWIRVMYLYPMYLSDALIQTIADSAKVLPYIDIPLQHINDRMLRRMARRVTRSETEQLLSKLRERIPELTLRTTLMTGFPGETDAEFQELLDFVRDQRFERLGVFTYSREPDTPAVQLPESVPTDVAETRRDQIMQAQQEIVFQNNEALVGRRLEVILDGPIPGEENVWLGRSKADAPEIDGVVYVTGQESPLDPGMIVRCEIVATQDYDLVGVAVD